MIIQKSKSNGYFWHLKQVMIVYGLILIYHYHPVVIINDENSCAQCHTITAKMQRSSRKKENTTKQSTGNA